MVEKKIVVGISFAVLATALTFICQLNFKKDIEETKPVQIQKIQQKTIPTPVKPPKNIADMYNSTVYDLPLFSIAQISTMPKALKEVVDKSLEEAQGFYLLNYNKDEQKVFIILQNQLSVADAYPRHNLEFMELYLNSEDGKVLKNLYSPAYLGQANESFFAAYSVHGSEEAWVLDDKSEVKRPLKHTYYDPKGKVKIQEIWNYDENKDIKYQLKGSSKNVISMLKEYKQGEDGLRKEHLFYDADGNLIISLTINYEGANITRIMYFDKHNTDECMSIIAYYSEGMKTKEEIYGNDYKLKNTVEAEYKDGERQKIKLLNSAGELVTEIEK